MPLRQLTDLPATAMAAGAAAAPPIPAAISPPGEQAREQASGTRALSFPRREPPIRRALSFNSARAYARDVTRVASFGRRRSAAGAGAGAGASAGAGAGAGAGAADGCTSSSTDPVGGRAKRAPNPDTELAQA